MKTRRVTKKNLKKKSQQLHVEKNEKSSIARDNVDDDLDTLFTPYKDEESSFNAINEVTMRKRKSKERVAESGYKTMTLNFDSKLILLLGELYESAGLKYIERGGEKCFKSEGLSALISYLISSFCNDLPADESLDYKVYLHKTLLIVKSRQINQGESAEQICDFLNANKFKRYTSSSIKSGKGVLWEPMYLRKYLVADTANELYKALTERPKRK